MGSTPGGPRPLAIGLGLALASALTAASLASAADGTLTVAQDGSGDYDSVIDAVAAAQDGDTVLVSPGTYSGTVVIDKDITLAGDGDVADIIIAATSRQVIDEDTGLQAVDDDGVALFEFVGIELADSDATVRGLTVMGSDDDGSIRLDDGIYAEGGAPTIDAVTIVNPVGDEGVPDTSIGTFESAATITGSQLSGNVWLIGASPTFEGNSVAASIGVFCGFDEATDLAITDCGANGQQAVVRGNTSTGIITGEGTTTVIEGNTLTGPRVSGMGSSFGEGAGIVLWGGGQDFGTAPTVSGNTVSGYDVAVVIRGKVGGEFGGNTVTGNGTGISVGSDLMVSGNTFSDNGIGVKVEAGAKPSLDGNTIEGNGLGLDLQRFAAPTLAGNVICNEKDISALGGDPPSLDGNEVCAAMAAS